MNRLNSVISTRSIGQRNHAAIKEKETEAVKTAKKVNDQHLLKIRPGAHPEFPRDVKNNS